MAGPEPEQKIQSEAAGQPPEKTFAQVKAAALELARSVQNLGHEEQINSLKSRIEQYGGLFTDPQRLPQVDEHFDPIEKQIVLEHGLVGGAIGGASVNFDEAQGGRNWLQAMGETVDAINVARAAKEQAAQLPAQQEIVVPPVVAEAAQAEEPSEAPALVASAISEESVGEKEVKVGSKEWTKGTINQLLTEFPRVDFDNIAEVSRVLDGYSSEELRAIEGSGYYVPLSAVADRRVDTLRRIRERAGLMLKAREQAVREAEQPGEKIQEPAAPEQVEEIRSANDLANASSRYQQLASLGINKTAEDSVEMRRLERLMNQAAQEHPEWQGGAVEPKAAVSAASGTPAGEREGGGSSEHEAQGGQTDAPVNEKPLTRREQYDALGKRFDALAEEQKKLEPGSPDYDDIRRQMEQIQLEIALNPDFFAWDDMEAKDVSPGLQRIREPLGLGQEAAATPEQETHRRKISSFVDNARGWKHWRDENVNEKERRAELVQAHFPDTEIEKQIAYAKRALTKDGLISLEGLANGDLDSWLETNEKVRDAKVAEYAARWSNLFAKELFEGGVNPEGALLGLLEVFTEQDLGRIKKDLTQLQSKARGEPVRQAEQQAQAAPAPGRKESKSERKARERVLDAIEAGIELKALLDVDDRKRYGEPLSLTRFSREEVDARMAIYGEAGAAISSEDKDQMAQELAARRRETIADYMVKARLPENDPLRARVKDIYSADDQQAIQQLIETEGE